MKVIDVNCDLGESYGSFKIGNDALVFPFITSCNIACGQHGGDPVTTEQTIQNAIKYGVQVGAHPSYPDLAGFGRRKMQLSADELKSIVKSQIAIIDGLARSYGTKLKYVKPHGALYNSLADDADEAAAFVSAIGAYDNSLAIMGLPHSELEKAARSANINFIKEGFIDRRYQTGGRLQARSEAGAVLENVDDMIQQFEDLVTKRQVKTNSGHMINMQIDSLCIHGDNPKAAALLTALHEKAKKLGVTIQKFDL
jgi:UPF0271 protein